ncbi:MAG: AraC family transcriptional regulator [Clostridia bacterium]|nr:AraC family transcriptional regulator [Clostridia bacterium]
MNTDSLPHSFRSPAVSAESDHIYFDHFGWQKSMPNERVYCFRNLYAVYYVNSGSGTLKINQNNYSLHSGDAFLIRANQSALYYSGPSDPWECFYFTFNGTMADELLQGTAFQSGKSVCKIDRDDIISRIVSLKNHFEDVSQNSLLSLEQLLRLLQFFIPSVEDGQDERHAAKPTVSSQYTKRAQDFIHNNYQNHISVSSIAKELSINRSLLYTYFKKETGTDLLAYLTEVRMQHARDWLSQTDITGSTIASMIGYNNYTSFQRAFTKWNGITPGQYRKEQQSQSTRKENISVLTDETYLEAKSGRVQSE